MIVNGGGNVMRHQVQCIFSDVSEHDMDEMKEKTRSRLILSTRGKNGMIYTELGRVEGD